MELRDSTLERRLDSTFHDTLGRKNGLVQKLALELPTPSEPGTKKTTCKVSPQDEVVPNDIERGVVASSSKPESVSAAFDGSIGEAIDRYCLRFPDDDDLVWESHEALDDRARTVDFANVDVYDHEAIAEHFEPFDETTELPWVSGTNLLTGEPVFVPAERIWFPSGALRGDYHMPTSSHGVAAGPSLLFALVNGLYETLESDGVMSVWARQRAPPAIDRESMAEHWPEVSEYVTEEIEVGPLSVRVFDCSDPVDVPTVGSVLCGPEGTFPRFAHSVNSHLDPREAVQEAVTEVATRFTYLYQKLVGSDLSSLSVYDVDNFESNRLYYSLPEHFEDVSFYVESGTEPVDQVYPDSSDGVSFESKAAEYRALLERFAAAEMAPIAVDLTTREIRDKGLRVVRVLTPDLVPASAAPVPPSNHPRLNGRVETTEPHPF